MYTCTPISNKGQNVLFSINSCVKHLTVPVFELLHRISTSSNQNTKQNEMKGQMKYLKIKNHFELIDLPCSNLSFLVSFPIEDKNIQWMNIQIRVLS